MNVKIIGLLKTTEPLMACYKITLDSGYFYYGSSVNVKNRISTWVSVLNNKCKSKHNELVKNAVTISHSARIEIVEYFLDKTKMRLYETDLISGSFDSELSLNISPSGLNNFGYKKLPNKTHSIPKKVVKLDSNGNVIEQYESIVSAAKKNGIRLPRIQKVLEGQKISHKGMFFSYKKEDGKYFVKTPREKTFKKGKRKNVAQLDANGGIVKIYKSIKEASVSLGVSTTGISLAICGKQKSASGFMWKYVE